MSDIFREIEQEIRRDEALKLWTRFQIPVYILAALIIIGVGVWRYWDYRQEQAAEAAGARYEAALQLGQSGKAAQSQAELEQIAKGQDGYALLARLHDAAALSQRDPAAGAKAYDAIASDPTTPQLLQQLAHLRAALLHVDDPNPANVEQRLRDLAAPGDPFKATAREQLALLALKRKDYAAAGRWLDMIVSDPLAPAAVRGRAESLEGLVASSGPPPKPQAPPAAKVLAPTPAAPSASASSAPKAAPAVSAPAQVKAPVAAAASQGSAASPASGASR